MIMIQTANTSQKSVYVVFRERGGGRTLLVYVIVS